MEDIDQSNAQIGLQQKNTLLQAWSDFKDSIFNVLFVILDKKSEEEEDESLLGLIIETGLDYLQIMAFPFNLIVIDAWNGGATLNNISFFFNKFNIPSYLPNAPFAAYLVMLYGLIFIILLIIADIIYVSYSFSKKKFKFTFPLVILANIVPLFVTVLFLPITETMLSVVQCQNKDGVLTMSSFPTVVCWQGWHLFHALIALLFITLFVVISTVVALALFEPRMTSKKLTARQNSNGQVVFIINKIVLQFFFSFKPFSGSTFYVILLFLLSFWQFWCYTIKQPYYTKTATKFFKICSTYYFWTTLMLLVGQLLSTYYFTGALVIWICGLPFFGIIIYFQGASDTSTLHANNMKFKTGDELDNHISCVLQLVAQQSGDKSSYMLLIGYIEKHKQICNQSDCPLKVETKKSKTASIQNMDYNCEQVLKQVDRMFKAGLKKFSDCTKLRMSFALFQLEKMHTKEKAFEQFVAASKLQPNFQQQFNIYRFKKIIRQNLQDREQSETDLVETIRFDNHVSLVEEAMLLSAKLHKQFWTELKQQKPDLKKLNTVGSQITEAGNTIIQNYKQLSKINSSSCQVLFSYAQYQILVNENFNQGKQLLANARKIFQDKQTGDKNEPQIQFQTDSFNKLTSPLLVVTYNEAQKTFKITNLNLMITEITGYQREQLFNKDLSVISTNIFQSMKLPCFKILASQQSEQSGLIKHKFNHLIAVKYTVKHKNDEWQITLKLDSQNNLKMIILADKEGNIKDYNLLAINLLKDLQDQCANSGQNLNLSHLQLNNWMADIYRTHNGANMYVKIGNRSGECNMQVEELKGSDNRDPNEQEVEISLQKQQINLGWKIILSKLQNTYVMEQMDNEETDLIQRNDSQLDEGVLQLYQNPNGVDFFLSKVQESKMIQERTYERENRFVLKQKISLMRLMDNQIKMVYANGNDNDYNDNSANITGQDDREVFKFDDEGYQAKLRTAINTNLSHGEVSNLRRMSVIFIILLFTLIIIQLTLQSNQISAVDDFINEISSRASQYSWLTRNVMASINQTVNYINYYNMNVNHTIDFSSDINVNLILQNGMSTTKNLKDAVIFLNSRLMSYFITQDRSLKTITSVFINYINSIFPTFLNYPNTLDINTSLSFIMGGVALALTISMMLYWIYISLKIDKKRYDIMIWFLDIPIPYVTHLGSHCDKYLKQFIGVKQLALKGIRMDQDEDNYEEYSYKKNNVATDQEEIEEQIKARKSLISKNKKETLISKINLSALKVLWLLAYSLFFSSLLLGMTQSFYQDFEFLQAQWIQSSQTIVVDNTLYIALQMQSKNISLPTINLPTLLDTLKISHKGVIIEGNLQSFNQAILNFHLTDISTIYNTVYFGNLCSVLQLNSTQLAQCTSLVGNKLQSGYQVYSKYLITPQDTMNNQIAMANGYYVIPALQTMIQTWQTSLTLQGNQLINLCTIMLYIFIIFSILAFLLLWLYYLRKLNTELNQTIQMLNMIPFKLLPKSRKETKMFIAWIIRQANKTIHQEQ